MKITHDEKYNLAYISLKDTIGTGEAAFQQEVVDNGDIILDFDADGRLIGIEMLDAETLLHPELKIGAVKIGGSQENLES